MGLEIQTEIPKVVGEGRVVGGIKRQKSLMATVVSLESINGAE